MVKIKRTKKTKTVMVNKKNPPLTSHLKPLNANKHHDINPDLHQGQAQISGRVKAVNGISTVEHSQSLDSTGVRVMVFNPTFNNISIILWGSILLVEEIGVPGETHQSAASHWQTLSHTVVSSTPRLSGIQTHNVSGDRH